MVVWNYKGLIPPNTGIPSFLSRSTGTEKKHRDSCLYLYLFATPKNDDCRDLDYRVLHLTPNPTIYFFSANVSFCCITWPSPYSIKVEKNSKNISRNRTRHLFTLKLPSNCLLDNLLTFLFPMMYFNRRNDRHRDIRAYDFGTQFQRVIGWQILCVQPRPQDYCYFDTWHQNMPKYTWFAPI